MFKFLQLNPTNLCLYLEEEPIGDRIEIFIIAVRYFGTTECALFYLPSLDEYGVIILASSETIECEISSYHIKYCIGELVVLEGCLLDTGCCRIPVFGFKCSYPNNVKVDLEEIYVQRRIFETMEYF